MLSHYTILVVDFKERMVDMALDYSVIGGRIKRARKSKRMTQVELSERMNVSIAYLSKVESGRIHLNLPRLSQICSILDVSEGQILDGVSNASNKYLDSEFSDLLKLCTPKNQKLIYKIAETIYNAQNN